MIMNLGAHMAKRAFPILAFAGLAACAPDAGLSTGGGSAADDGSGLGGAVGLATAPYLVLDLATGTVVSQTAVVATAAEYKGAKMLFRRISGNGDDYFVGVFEVTQEQWGRIAGASSTPWNNLNPLPSWQAAAVASSKPAFNLSYDAISSAVSAYNGSHGAKLGIPSDGEWAYACAAGSSATWSWGTDAGTPSVLAGRAVVKESQLGVAGPRAVGTTAANGYGIYDMHGNVWEWTSGTHVRGGSWNDPAWTARTANKAGSDDDAGIDASVAHALFGVRLTIKP